MPDTFLALGNGITRIDTGHTRPAQTACYMIAHEGQAAFVDTGTFHTVPRLLELLDANGIAREDVAYVMPTHVHLDHAGGAGELMRRLPSAQLVVHPRGARHMIDPGKLEAATAAVYGDDVFREQFGELAPVSESRVLLAQDEMSVSLGNRRLLLLDSPGHASHHYCVYDEISRGFFTGDTFGVSFREFDVDGHSLMFPTTSPVQFDPDAWNHTLDRLLRFEPQRMYVTHFGMVEGNIAGFAENLRQGIERHADIARGAADSRDRHADIKRQLTDLLVSEIERMDCGIDIDTAIEKHAIDLELNAQGLGIWLDRQARRA